MRYDFSDLIAGPDLGPAFAIYRPGAIIKTTQGYDGEIVQYDATRFAQRVRSHATGEKGTPQRRRATFFDGPDFLYPTTAANNLVIKQLEEMLNHAGKRAILTDELFIISSRLYDLAELLRHGSVPRSVRQRLSVALRDPAVARPLTRKQVLDRLTALANLMWTAAVKKTTVVYRSHRSIASAAGYDGKRNTKATWNAIEDLRSTGLIHVLDSGMPGTASRAATTYEMNPFGTAAFLIQVLRGVKTRVRAVNRAGKTAREAIAAAFSIDPILREELALIREARKQFYLAMIRAKDWFENTRAPDHILAM